MTPEQRVKKIAAKTQLASSKMAKDLRVGRSVIVSPAAEVKGSALTKVSAIKGVEHAKLQANRKQLDKWATGDAPAKKLSRG